MSEISLKDFVSENSGRPRRCATCGLPEEILAEVNEALRNEVGPKIINSWLSEVKKIKIPSVQYHKSAGHAQ